MLTYRNGQFYMDGEPFHIHSGSDSMKQLLKAMYNYYLAAKQFVVAQAE